MTKAQALKTLPMTILIIDDYPALRYYNDILIDQIAGLQESDSTVDQWVKAVDNCDMIIESSQKLKLINFTY